MFPVRVSGSRLTLEADALQEDARSDRLVQRAEAAAQVVEVAVLDPEATPSSYVLPKRSTTFAAPAQVLPWTHLSSTSFSSSASTFTFGTFR